MKSGEIYDGPETLPVAELAPLIQPFSLHTGYPSNCFIYRICVYYFLLASQNLSPSLLMGAIHLSWMQPYRPPIGVINDVNRLNHQQCVVLVDADVN